ncbi:MAG: hypothetical protein ABJA83_12585 [Burkholderiaceae bacterium]
MTRRNRIVAVALAAMLCANAADAGVPLWQRVLRWVSGETSDTLVQTHMMGKHMQMSVRQTPQPGDAARAEEIRDAARRVLERYRDVADAEAGGYAPFAPTGRIGEEVHYTHHWRASNEKSGIDLDRPGSILYKRTAKSMHAVGVMYTAPGHSLPWELDQRVPLSVGVWHRHVHFCGWPSGTPRKDWDGPGARFGFAGSIGDEATCRAADGYWIPLALGWMTHVYPNETELDKIWIGDQMMQLNTAEVEHNAHKEQKH